MTVLVGDRMVYESYEEKEKIDMEMLELYELTNVKG